MIENSSISDIFYFPSCTWELEVKLVKGIYANKFVYILFKSNFTKASKGIEKSLNRAGQIANQVDQGVNMGLN